MYAFQESYPPVEERNTEYDNDILSFLWRQRIAAQEQYEPAGGIALQDKRRCRHFVKTPDLLKPSAIYIWHLYLEAFNPNVRDFISNYCSRNASFLHMMISTPPAALAGKDTEKPILAPSASLVQENPEVLWYSISKLSDNPESLFEGISTLDDMESAERFCLFTIFLSNLQEENQDITWKSI
ncbi:hypothetical protein TWF481_010400 [Arthrobotrys musiformis]|uniref:Uncharacterized protein n=1 Tax=Arthrobotrys musiformis TaxID=47236 RepID=A0AAV9W0M6_9PEZI